MTNFMTATLFLAISPFLMIGCVESLITEAIEEIKNNIDDDDPSAETPQDILTLIKTTNGFTLTWDKKDTEFNEVIYRNIANDTREVIMEGTNAMLRSYQCIEEDQGSSVDYICIGFGTPALGDSAEGEIVLTFKKELEYAFFVEGSLIHNILSHSHGTLLINGQ